MIKKIITFEENNNSCLTYQEDKININPKFITKFGHIKITIKNNKIEIEPNDFEFNSKGKNNISANRIII